MVKIKRREGPGTHARGGVMELERAESSRCMRPVEEFGVSWGFEYANSYPDTFFKDLLGKIETVCSRQDPVTDSQFRKLFPGIATVQVQELQQKIGSCAACMTSPHRHVSGLGHALAMQGNLAACGARMLHAIHTGMQKFWSEIEGDREYVD